MTLSESIAALVNYGMETGLTPACEKIYTTNLLLDIFHEDDYEEPSQIPSLSLEEILKELLDEAVRRELIPDSIAYRDLFDTRLMNCLLPRPAQVQADFWKQYLRKQPLLSFTNSLRTATTSAVTGYVKIRNGRSPVIMERSTLPSICPSRRRIPKPLPLPEMQKQVLIPNVSFAWKMKAMPDGSIIRPEKTTGLSPSPSTTANGASSTLHTYTIMNTVSYSTVSMSL